MFNLIAKHIGFPLQDFVNKTRIIREYDFLLESQWWDEEKMLDFQSNKLKNLIEFAYKNVPYYDHLFHTIKIKPTDIKTIFDLEKIPLLTKEIVRKENMNLVARNFDLRYVKKGKTGGTTGAPVIVYKDVNDRSNTWGSYYRWYKWMGIKYTDKTATLWGARTILTHSKMGRIKDSLINFLQNRQVIDTFIINKFNHIQVYNKLCAFKPVLLKGYLSSMIDLARFITDNGLEGLTPKVLSSTTETLLPHNRTYLEKVFNAPIFDQYGCGEVSGVAYECPAHNGLHITQEHTIVEILDDQNSPLVEKSGRIVLTNLDNYVMPFIRYENGDMASLTNSKCECGISHPKIKSIDGRTTDVILLKNGTRVHGVFFTDILYELGILADIIQRFQVYQETPGAIEFRIECEKPLERIIKAKLIASLKRFFLNVTLTEHARLPNEKNGKFKYIINKVEFT